MKIKSAKEVLIRGESLHKAVVQATKTALAHNPGWKYAPELATIEYDIEKAIVYVLKQKGCSVEGWS